MKTSIQLAGIVASALMLAFSSCKKDENTSQPPVAADAQNQDRLSAVPISEPSLVFTPGYVYTQSNAKDANAVYVYAQQGDGSLKLQSVAKTGGLGSGDALGSQNSVVIDDLHMFLYAVNAGDNTISAFRLVRDGNLSLAGVVSSNGIRPVSLTTYRNLLYVVNTVSTNIAGYYTNADVGPNGTSRMIPIQTSIRKLSSAAARPAQISFSPNGAHLYVTEKGTNLIDAFTVGRDGGATPAYLNPSIGKTPFGFAFAYQGAMVVSNADNDIPFAGSVTSYLGANSGTLLAAGNPVSNKQTSSCWVAATSAGRFVYVTNTHSNSISIYAVGDYGRLRLLYDGVAGGFAPTDIVVDAFNQHVYAISTGDRTIKQYNRRADGYIYNIIADGGGMINLPAGATGLATFSPGLAGDAISK